MSRDFSAFSGVVVQIDDLKTALGMVHHHTLKRFPINLVDSFRVLLDQLRRQDDIGLDDRNGWQRKMTGHTR